VSTEKVGNFCRFHDDVSKHYHLESGNFCRWGGFGGEPLLILAWLLAYSRKKSLYLPSAYRSRRLPRITQDANSDGSADLLNRTNRNARGNAGGRSREPLV